jgi:alpha/beta superfamily hydrolase
VRLETADGLTLEARWDTPQYGPSGAVVVCHPHPLHGGTMQVPLIRALTASLVDAGRAVLRFNFRGVGASDGVWDGGIGEVDDVAAAVATAGRTYPDLPLGLVGWSFGAMTSLRWQARDGNTLPWAGVAPPLRLSTGGDLPEPDELPPARRLFIIGDRDQFTADEDLAAYAADAGARFELLRGSDHFFYFRERRVGDLVAEFLGPSAPAAQRRLTG